jgi:RNA polymerase sigma-70 factor (ECF subfamily)
LHAGQPPLPPAADDPALQAWIDRLYAEHGPALLRYLRRLAGADGDPADLLHETFLRVCARPPGEPIDNERAWLFRIATNVAHNGRRDAQRLRARDQAAAGALPVSGDVVHQLEVRERVAQALAVIDDERGRLALLLFAEGFTYREIADILELAPGHVGVLIQRARDQVRRRIDPAR